MTVLVVIGGMIVGGIVGGTVGAGQDRGSDLPGFGFMLYGLIGVGLGAIGGAVVAQFIT